MSVLYIRHRPENRWINFIGNTEELKEAVGSYMGGQILIGDLTLFNDTMSNMLLKFIEENPFVDCYSSVDLQNSVLLSRFSQIVKDKLIIKGGITIDEFRTSKREFADIEGAFGSRSADIKLRLYHARNSMLNLLLSVNE